MPPCPRRPPPWPPWPRGLRGLRRRQLRPLDRGEGGWLQNRWQPLDDRRRYLWRKHNGRRRGCGSWRGRGGARCAPPLAAAAGRAEPSAVPSRWPQVVVPPEQGQTTWHLLRRSGRRRLDRGRRRHSVRMHRHLARALIRGRLDMITIAMVSAIIPAAKMAVSELPINRNGLLRSDTSSGSEAMSAVSRDESAWPRNVVASSARASGRPWSRRDLVSRPGRRWMRRSAAHAPTPARRRAPTPAGVLQGDDRHRDRSFKCAVTAVTSTPEPTTNMPWATDSSASRLVTISLSTAIASALCRLWLSTFTTEPSAVSTASSRYRARRTSVRSCRSPPPGRPPGRGPRRRATRNQQHILDVAGDQRLPQHGRFGVVSPGHPGRHQMVAGGERALLGTQDRGDDVIGRARGCRAVDGGDVEDVVLDDDTGGLRPQRARC